MFDIGRAKENLHRGSLEYKVLYLEFRICINRSRFRIAIYLCIIYIYMYIDIWRHQCYSIKEWVEVNHPPGTRRAAGLTVGVRSCFPRFLSAGPAGMKGALQCQSAWESSELNGAVNDVFQGRIRQKRL